MQSSISFTFAPIEVPPTQPADREIGALLDFQGLVRELENGQPLTGLAYEAYEPMARRTLESIFSQLHQLHPISAINFIHRLGWVPVGEASLFIRIQSSHRAQALAFCAAAIDWLKRDVPIWKLPPARTA